jgi:NCS1 family nucleobase:cation symporter-1
MTTADDTASVPTLAPAARSVVERHSIDYIPENERYGRVSQQGVFWFLSNTQSLSVAVGFLGPALGLSIWWTVLATLLGTLFGTTFMALHASQGPHLGLPQMLQSRAQFGYRGVVVPLLAPLFGNVAYVILDTVILDVGLHSIFGLNQVLVGVVAGALAVALAVFGYDWMHKAFRWFFWLSLPFWLVLSAAIIFGHAGGHPPATHLGFVFVPFAAQFSYAASINLSYAPVVSDYSRYLPRSTPFRRVIAAVHIGASAPLVWLVALGAWLASRLNATDALTGMDTAGNAVFGHFGDALVVVSSLVLIVTMGLCVYSAGLEALTGAESLGLIRRGQGDRRLLRGSVIAALGVIGAVIGIPLHNENATVNNLVLIVYYVLIPWTTVNLIDYFFVRRGRYAITHLDRPDGVYGTWSWRGILAYLLGLASIVPFANLTFFHGWAVGPLDDVDISWVVGIAVTGAVYFAVTRSLDLSRDEQAISESNAELQALGLAVQATGPAGSAQAAPAQPF